MVDNRNSCTVSTVLGSLTEFNGEISFSTVFEYWVQNNLHLKSIRWSLRWSKPFLWKVAKPGFELLMFKDVFGQVADSKSKNHQFLISSSSNPSFSSLYKYDIRILALFGKKHVCFKLLQNCLLRFQLLDFYINEFFDDNICSPAGGHPYCSSYYLTVENVE